MRSVAICKLDVQLPLIVSGYEYGNRMRLERRDTSDAFRCPFIKSFKATENA